MTPQERAHTTWQRTDHRYHTSFFEEVAAAVCAAENEVLDRVLALIDEYQVKHVTELVEEIRALKRTRELTSA